MKMDDELKSMRSCVSAIEELPLEARARVASYLFERYGDLSLHTETVKRSIEKMEALEQRIAQRETEVADLLQQLRMMPITPRDDEPSSPFPSLVAAGRAAISRLTDKERELLKQRFKIEPEPEGDPSAGGEVGGPDEDDDPDINDLEDSEEPSVISATDPPPPPREPDDEGLVEV